MTDKLGKASSGSPCQELKNQRRGERGESRKVSQTATVRPTLKYICISCQAEISPDKFIVIYISINEFF